MRTATWREPQHLGTRPSASSVVPKPSAGGGGGRRAEPAGPRLGCTREVEGHGAGAADGGFGGAAAQKVRRPPAWERAGLPMAGIAAAIRAGRLSFAFLE